MMVGFAGFVLVRPGAGDFTPRAANVFQAVVAGGAVAACARASLRSAGRARRGWALIASSAGAWTLGQVIWTGYEFAGSQAPFPSPADIGFLLAPPLMVGGLLSLPATQRAERTRRLADGIIVAGSLLAMAWALVIGHVVAERDAGASSLALAYPASDIVVLVVVISLLSQSVGGWRRPLGVIGAGLLCITLADAAYAYLTATDAFATGGLLDVGWAGGYLLIALAGLESPGRVVDAKPARSALWLANLPYLTAALMVVVVAATSARDHHVDSTVAAIGAVVLLLMLFRQVLVHSANLALTARLDRQRTILLSVLHSLGEGVVVADEGGNLVLFNEEAQRLGGDDVLDTRRGPMAGAVTGEASVDTVTAGERTLCVTGRPVRDHDGEIRGGVVVYRDETERRRAEAELRDRESQLAAAQHLASVGSWEVDLTNGVTTWSAQQYRLLDYEPGEVTPDSELFLEHVHPDDRDIVRGATAKAYIGDNRFAYRCRVETVAGRLRWLDVQGRVETEIGVPKRLTGMAQDVTDRIEAEQALRRQATEDALTGLPNRSQLAGALSDRLERRRPGEGVALLLMDLDRFKEVNDSLGHEVGDRVLVEAAHRLRQAVRTSDIVTRLGGDEFAIVVSDLADESAAATVAANLLQQLELPVDLDGISIHLGASIGVAYAPVHGEDASVLLQKADVAMYRAKNEAIGWAVYGPGDDQDRLSRLTLLGDLRGALDRDEIVVHYQPQVDLKTGRTHVVEALARWHHPTLGMVPPNQFIPLAEQAGMIRQLTDAVLRQALGQCRKWRAEGIEVGVAVNISPRSLVDPDLVSSVHAVLRQADLPPSVLTLEITESAFAERTAEAVRMLEDLRDLGVRLCIDDFGTGYSSMAYLKHLPVDELKIDRAFVFELDSDSRDISIVRAIVELAHSLGLSVVAEGVESDTAGRLLTALHCDVAQGYGLCRPAAATDITSWLSARNDAVAAPYSEHSSSIA